MKKTLLCAAIAVFSLTNLSGQTKIAYITDLSAGATSTYPNDTRILSALKADVANYTVTEIAATTATPDFSGYDMIIISEPAPSAGPAVLACKTVAKPILNMKVFAYKTGTTTWAWVSANSVIIDNVTATTVVVNKPNHPIFTGLNVSKGSELQLISAAAFVIGSTTATKGLNGLTSYNNVVGTIDTLATIKDATTGQLCVMEIPSTTSVGGTLVARKFLQIGISGTSYANVTDAGITMVKNAIAYLITPIVSGVQEIAKTELSVNRTSSALEIMTDHNLTLALYSSCGQLVSRTVGRTIAIDQLSQGIYVLKMVDATGSTQTYKFLR